jgi:hypothetical protein
MFGALGGAVTADLAMEAFEDDVKLAGRQVSSNLDCPCLADRCRSSMCWQRSMKTLTFGTISPAIILH